MNSTVANTKQLTESYIKLKLPMPMEVPTKLSPKNVFWENVSNKNNSKSFKIESNLAGVKVVQFSNYLSQIDNKTKIKINQGNSLIV